MVGDFENALMKHPRISAPPTHFQKFVENFKIEVPRSWKKFWCLQKQHDSLNHFQFFETKKRPYEKNISNPGIQPMMENERACGIDT